MRARTAHELRTGRPGRTVLLIALLGLAPACATATPPETYTVEDGDTLWSVAERLRADTGVSTRDMVRLLFAHNPQAFADDVHSLQAGAVLELPPLDTMQAHGDLDLGSGQAARAEHNDKAGTGARVDAENNERRGFVFGDASNPEDDEAAASPQPAWDLRVDDALIEVGVLGSSGRPVDRVQYARGIFSLRRALNDRWDLRLGARLDARWQQGGDRPDTSRGQADYDETFLRYNGEHLRVTAGAQKILWGRVDEIPPTDRLSTQDLTRFALDDLADRRRASPAIRLEWFQGPWHTDVVLLPWFRAAELPERDSLWHPVDRTRGRLLGLPEDPALAPLIRAAELDEKASGSDGGGVRLSRAGRGVDFSVTVQRTRHSEPYYRLDGPTREAVLAGTPPSATPVLELVHPRTWVLGGDIAFAMGAWTWRAEAAWLSDVPVTRATNLRLDTVRGVDWVIGAEGFPGDGDLRTTVQLAGQHLLNAGGILDNRDAYSLAGEFEAPFAAHTWRARLRYSVGLNRRDVYLNPELAWIAREPIELYVGAHWLDGTAGTPGTFYRDNRMLVFGWRGQF